MADLIRGLRYAIRQLRRSPGFAVTVVLTLALGLGATTGIFALVHAIVLRSLAYPAADRLVWIRQPVPKYDAQRPWAVSEAGYWDYRGNVPALAGLGAFFTTDVDVGLADGARQVSAARVTTGLLGVLGARTAVGRPFTAAEDRPGAAPVALLSYAYWQGAFGGDRGVVGRTLRMSGEPTTVIGVLAPDVRLPGAEADVWQPAQLDPAATPQNSHYLGVVGRLAPGATLPELNAQLNRRVAGFPERYPQAYSPQFMREFGFRAEALPLRALVLGTAARGLWILLGGVGLLLLIACASITNLFLVREEGRAREYAVRAALGAGRGRLARHALVESLLLALLAGVLALGVAQSGVALLLAHPALALPRLGEVRVGGAEYAFCAALALAVGIAFGLLPLLDRHNDLPALRAGALARANAPVARRTRAVLVGAQAALAVVLLAASALLLRSFQRLREVDPGFHSANVLTVQVALPRTSYPDYDRTTAFWRAATDRIRALPEVAAVGAGAALPVQGGEACAVLVVEGLAPERAGEAKCVAKAAVVPGYFEALGIPVSGRIPDWHDVDAGTGAIVVSRTLAERLWPGEHPIGKGLRGGTGTGGRYYRVAGVTGALRMDGLEQPATPIVFFPVRSASDSLRLWGPARSLTVVVRARGGSPERLTAAIRRTLTALDPDVAVGDVATMRQVVGRSTARTTFLLLLLGFAGGMALLLAAIGVYGVIAYLVERRRGEIGVRMALGATAAAVGRLVVGESVRLAAVGAGVGLVAAVFVTRLLRSLLFEVSPADPLALALAVLVLMVAALAASLLPALRAARVDPARALRAE